MTNNKGAIAQEWESKIGIHYDLPMISFHDAIWSEIKAGRLQWAQLSPDEVHPNDAGHRLAGELVYSFMEKALKKFSPHKIPVISEQISSPLISDAFEFTSLFDGKDLIPLTNQDWITNRDSKRNKIKE